VRADEAQLRTGTAAAHACRLRRLRSGRPTLRRPCSGVPSVPADNIMIAGTASVLLALNIASPGPPAAGQDRQSSSLERIACIRNVLTTIVNSNPSKRRGGRKADIRLELELKVDRMRVANDQRPPSTCLALLAGILSLQPQQFRLGTGTKYSLSDKITVVVGQEIHGPRQLCSGRRALTTRRKATTGRTTFTSSL
jgi:hypothetical protein